MPKTTTTQIPVNVTVPRRWQVAFVVAMIGTVVVGDATMIWDMVHVSRYVSSGTLAIQTSMWIYPVLYLLVALLFVRRRIRGGLPQLFWAVLVAAIGTAVYQVVGAFSQLYRQETHYTIHGNSVWDSFGFDWIVMAVILVLYAGTLLLITRKGRRP